MMSFLKILRPVNLLIVALTQILLVFGILGSAFANANVTNLLDWKNGILFILCTTIVAGSGNLINDIYDFKTDLVNKPEKTFIPELISVKLAWIYYIILVFTGAVISFYIALITDHLKWLWLYPFSVLMLFFYSYKIKALPVLGNLVVSSFIAGVFLIILFTERNALSELRELNEVQANNLEFWILCFCGFAFLTNMARELSKDIQDLNGDRLSGFKTLPIIIGVSQSKIILTLYNALFILGMTLILFFRLPSNRVILGLFIVLFLWGLIVSQKTITAVSKFDFERLSRIYKIGMLIGLMTLYLVTNPW